MSTTSSIAKKTDIFEGSLWYHFNSKNDLVSVHTELFLDYFKKERIHSESNDHKDWMLGIFSIYEVLWGYRCLMRDSFEQFSTDNSELYKRLIDINLEIDEWAKQTTIHARNLGVLIIQD